MNDQPARLLREAQKLVTRANIVAFTAAATVAAVAVWWWRARQRAKTTQAGRVDAHVTE
jgi:multidrug resistance efflux pump